MSESTDVNNLTPENGVEEEPEEFRPFDPEKISIETKPITMDTCLRRLEQGTIILNPDFQRNEIWTQEKKCRLIESLMLKIPLPMFYVSADEQGRFNVVDGLQRLSTIRSFVLGDDFLKTKNQDIKGKGFALEQLEFWGKSYNGMTFAELPVNIQNRILETGFTFTIINPGTPEEVKRNIFKRLNTGGEPLTNQEIRHALYVGKSTIFLKKISETTEFLEATCHSVRSDRMMDRELILRCVSFMVRDHSTYPKTNDMDSFLSDTMRILNILPDLESKESTKVFRGELKKEDILLRDMNQIEAAFNRAMIRSRDLFGQHAFRTSFPDERRTKINKSLFEVCGAVLSKITDDQYTKVRENFEDFTAQFVEFLQNAYSDYTLSKDSLKFQSVKYRHEKLLNLMTSY